MKTPFLFENDRIFVFYDPEKNSMVSKSIVIHIIKLQCLSIYSFILGKPLCVSKPNGTILI